MSQQSKYDSSTTMHDESEEIEEKIATAVDECIEECGSEGVPSEVLADVLDEQARRVRREELDETRYDVGHHSLTRAAGEFELVLRAYHRVYGEDEQEQDLSEVLHRLEAIISEVERNRDEITPALESMDGLDDSD